MIVKKTIGGNLYWWLVAGKEKLTFLTKVWMSFYIAALVWTFTREQCCNITDQSGQSDKMDQLIYFDFGMQCIMWTWEQCTSYLGIRETLLRAADSSRRGRECEIAATGCFLPLRHNVQRLPGPSCTVSRCSEHFGGGPGSGRVAID